MFGSLNNKQIEQVLHHQLVGRIGCHSDGVTYVVPISYAYDGEYIYGHTTEGMKIRMMRKNPKVCFQVDEMENMGNWKSVITWGDFEELTEEVCRNQAIEKLLDRILPQISSKTVQLGSQWPFIPDEPERIKGIIYRIRLHTKTGRFEQLEAVSSYIA